MNWAVGLAVGLLAAGWGYRTLRARKQAAFLENYTFHPALKKRVGERYPHLDGDDIELVFDGLRQYFGLSRKARRRMLAMPSQVVDVAWHEFILFTRAYQDFSRRALGRFLHHTPSEAMRSPTSAHQGIKRAWRLACADEGIDPRQPKRLPLLFAIDERLHIADGFHYVPDCSATPKRGSGDAPVYCASHIGCASGCGGDSGGADGGASDGGGSSCGGGGCGGD